MSDSSFSTLSQLFTWSPKVILVWKWTVVWGSAFKSASSSLSMRNVCSHQGYGCFTHCSFIAVISILGNKLPNFSDCVRGEKPIRTWEAACQRCWITRPLCLVFLNMHKHTSISDSKYWTLPFSPPWYELLLVTRHRVSCCCEECVLFNHKTHERNIQHHVWSRDREKQFVHSCLQAQNYRKLNYR